MEKIFNKTRVLIWTVIALAVLNVATIGTIVWHLRSFENAGKEGFWRNNRHRSGYDGRFNKQMMFKKLNFSPTQNTEFKKLDKNYRDTAWFIASQLHQLREEMFNSLNVQNADMRKVEVIADSIGTLHKQLKMKTAFFYLNVRKICTPQQADSLENFFKRILGQEPDVPFPPHFRGKFQNHPELPRPTHSPNCK